MEKGEDSVEVVQVNIEFLGIEEEDDMIMDFRAGDHSPGFSHLNGINV